METTAHGVGREVHTARGRRPSAVCSASRHTPSVITSVMHERISNRCFNWFIVAVWVYWRTPRHQLKLFDSSYIL